ESDDEVLVNVVDTQAPIVTTPVNVTQLWPPNHAMQRVANRISAADACDVSPALVVSVASNEPEDGSGDGDTAPDWQIVSNGDGTFDVWVRAERSGSGNGRVYTITAAAVEASGNSATRTAQVFVPHSQNKPNAGATRR